MTRGEYVERLRNAEDVHVHWLRKDWPQRGGDRESLWVCIAVIRALRHEIARVEGCGDE